MWGYTVVEEVLWIGDRERERERERRRTASAAVYPLHVDDSTHTIHVACIIP